MISKPLDQITLQDIEDLKINEVSEGLTLDYKLTLPGDNGDDKKEFLRDVTAFANTAGGDLIFGVREKRDEHNKNMGVPEAVEGVVLENLDEVVQRFDSLIRDGVMPRLAGCRFKFLSLDIQRYIVVLRVPKSWTAPHMITFRRSPAFYARTNAGKYPLDVSELRAAFLLSDTLGQRLARFRDERLAKITNDDTPVPLITGPRLTLHTIPVSGVQGLSPIDPQMFVKSRELLWVPEESGLSGRYTFDGYLTYGSPWETSGEKKLYRGYMQAFRDGSLEYATAYIAASEKKKYLWSVAFEEFTLTALSRHFELLSALGLTPPVFAVLSLTGVLGYKLDLPDSILRQPRAGQLAIDRDTLRVPEILVEDFEQDVGVLMRPAFDAVWQAAGFQGSPNYDGQGRWVGDKK